MLPPLASLLLLMAQGMEPDIIRLMVHEKVCSLSNVC